MVHCHSIHHFRDSQSKEMSKMKPFQKVRLLTDKYVDEGIKKGDIGVILEDYDGENFEVEFSDNNGITIALFAFPKSELELVE